MIILSPDVKEKVGQGIEYATKAVVPTMGPLGKNIAYDPKIDVPFIVNSGREIVSHINFEDKAVMVGVDVVKQAMDRDFWTAGDGAVATASLVGKLWSEATRLEASGADTMSLVRGIRKASEVAVGKLASMADRIESTDDVRALAKCAAAGRDDVADMVTEVYEHIGPNGYVTVSDSQMAESHITYFKGVKWEKGYSGFFEDPSISMEDVSVLLINRIIDKFDLLAPVLQEARDNGKAILIIAREFKDEVVSALHYVRDRAMVNVMGVVAPGYGDVRESNMKYFGIMFGTKVYDDMLNDVGEPMTLADCGHVDKAVINKKETVLQGIPNADDPVVESRRAELRKQLTQMEDGNEQYRIEQMLTPLAGDTAEILVGGVMEMEMFERKYLTDNAVHNVYGSVKSGFLPGGGKGYILAVSEVNEFAKTLNGDEALGAKIFAEALCAPAFNISENAGYDGKNVVDTMLNSKNKYDGFDVILGKHTDLKKSGILDCAGVIISAITTAVSSVSTAISIGACVVGNDPEE